MARGTHLSVEFIIGLMADGWSEAEILGNYPGVTHEDIIACLAYACCRHGEGISERVGWVERSETHRAFRMKLMGFAALNPSYVCYYVCYTTAAMALAPRAPRITTSQGGTDQKVSSRKATVPIAKSCGAKIALVQTGR
jgi:Protein of unknown function (DUF433)